jgi:hypothetical protein
VADIFLNTGILKIIGASIILSPLENKSDLSNASLIFVADEKNLPDLDHLYSLRRMQMFQVDGKGLLVIDKVLIRIHFSFF